MAEFVPISIHALRVEGDVFLAILANVRVFLSTPSVWRATRSFLNWWQKPRISIHALRVEGDIL